MWAVCDVRQSRGGGVSARRTLHRSVAPHWAVVAWRADVVQRGVQRLHASFSNVADPVTIGSTVEGSGDRTSTAAEIALSALLGGTCEAWRSAVVTRCALGALTDIAKAVAVTVGAVGAQVFSGEASP